MASELIAEAITDYFGERCLDYAEGCPTCEAWAEYDRWATRPAPAATDTGLVTAELRQEIFKLAKDLFWRADGNQRLWSSEEREVSGLQAAMQIARSQTEELLSAERAKKEKLEAAWLEAEGIISDLEADNAALTARVKELGDERYKLAYAITGGEDAPGYLDSLSAETLVEVARKNTQHWFAETDRADKAETKLAAYEKQLSKDRKLRNEAQCDADLWRFSVDMGDQPSLLVKVWKQRKALEANLAAAEKALTEIACFTQTTNLLWWQERARAVLGGNLS